MPTESEKYCWVVGDSYSDFNWDTPEDAHRAGIKWLGLTTNDGQIKVFRHLVEEVVL